MTAGNDKERLVIVETRLDHVEKDQVNASTDLKDLEKSSSQSFSDIKESTVNLRVSVEVLAKTQEQHGSWLANVEGEVKALATKVDELDTAVQGVASSVTMTRVRAAGWIAGATLVLTLGWGWVGDSVKGFASNVIHAGQTSSLPASKD